MLNALDFLKTHRKEGPLRGRGGLVAENYPERITFSCSTEMKEWLESMSGGRPFANVSHACRVAVEKLQEEYEEDPDER